MSHGTQKKLNLRSETTKMMIAKRSLLKGRYDFNRLWFHNRIAKHRLSPSTHFTQKGVNCVPLT